MIGFFKEIKTTYNFHTVFTLQIELSIFLRQASQIVFGNRMSKKCHQHKHKNVLIVIVYSFNLICSF
jgi:hypothetical protein